MLTVEQIIIRLVLSILLSGFIGLERESIKKPAGFRTHILVCVGSTLIMLVGIHMYELYKYETTLDPVRLGAQVISGIGFLGAGTIIREGSSVKGLTTAAGLWAVACIGLAIGAGFYIGGIITALFVLITLFIFSKIERHIITRRKNFMNLKMTAHNKPGQLGKIGQTLGAIGASIVNIEIESENEDRVYINMIIKIPENTSKLEIFEQLNKVDGIMEINEDI